MVGFWIIVGVLLAMQVVNIVQNIRDDRPISGPVFNIVLVGLGVVAHISAST